MATKKTPAKTTKKKATTKKPRVSTQKTKIDWFEARKAYLSDGTLSYKDIAKLFKISLTTVEKRAKSEGWVELRQELGEKAFNELTEKLVNIKTSANDRHLQHYQNLQALANRSIQEMDKNSYFTDRKGNLLYTKQDDGSIKPIKRPINPFELEKLARALKEAINGERVVLGLPTSVSAITDPDGGNPWSGFADMIKEAEKVISEYESDRDKSSGGNS